MQVDDLQGLENSELRNKVGYNIPDGTIVHLTGSNVDTAAALRHAGTSVLPVFSNDHLCLL